MTDTRKPLRLGAVRLFAALVAVTFALSASPADARWMPNHGPVVATGVAGGVAWSLKEHLGGATEQVGEALGAFFRGDADGLDRISEELKRLPGKIGMDAHPVLSLGTRALDAARDKGRKFKKRLESAIGRLAGRAGETFADARAALAIDRDEQPYYESEARVLGKAPLPSVKISRIRQAPDSYPKSLAEAWGMDAETIRRSRDPATWAPKPDPWGQDEGQGWDSPPAASAATKTDVWGDETGERKNTPPAGASMARADPWGQAAGQKWNSPAGTPVAGDVGGELTDTEWQNEYAAALNHFLGLDDDDSSYEAALSTVERLEREAVERERLAEQQRLEAQERERQARLEAEKRERQIARMEAELESAREERRSRASDQAFVRGVQNAVRALQPMLDHTAALVQKDKEARLRRDLARLRERARAEQAHAVIERQRQQAAEQQRRQAAKQARLEQDLRRSVRKCEDTRVLLVNECLPSSSNYFECTENNRRIIERHVQSCKQRVWDSYNRSGGKTILGVGRLQ